jgi:ABC-2 type transport system permease protein
VVLAVLMSGVFWVGLFLVTYEGFTFLHREAGAFSRETVEKVFNLFYASLMVMLVFSGGLILYGGMYRSREVAFLMTTPTRYERIFTYKFHEACAFSSWGFLLLGTPMLIAYGIVVSAPWYYYLMILPFMLAFVAVPAGIGAILCMLIVYFLTRLRRALTVLGAVGAVAAVGGVAWYVTLGQANDPLTIEWFEETMLRLSATENRLFPSWWLSSGLLEAARGEGRSVDYQPWAQAVLFLALMVANALFIHQVAVWLSARIYQPGYSRLHTERTPARRTSVAWIDRTLPRLLIFTPPKIRLLLVKDLRTFRRDPVQWAQFLIFFGLVGLYFINVQSMRYGAPFVGWVNMVSFLNLMVVGLILSTFTTRFIFPMISLEGRRFWILGLLPLRRETILWGKFLFAALGCAVPSCLLVFCSDMLLGISWFVMLIHQLACLVLCAGLSALAVGLGARMPDLRETNPAKIAAGFGGTLNLVLSALYILVVVALTAIPTHLYVLSDNAQLATKFNPHLIRSMMIGGVATAVVLGAAVTVFSLRMGFRSFRQLEF